MFEVLGLRIIAGENPTPERLFNKHISYTTFKVLFLCGF